MTGRNERSERNIRNELVIFVGVRLFDSQCMQWTQTRIVV